MKKYLLALAATFIMLNAQAQNSKVVSAWNYLQNNELMKGKAAIDEASADESTSTKPKTWYYKGLIYESIALDSNLCKKNPGLCPGALFDAVTAFAKACELDVKNDYKDKIRLQLDNLKTAIYNMAAIAYKNKNYEQAYMGFNGDAKIDEVIKNYYKEAHYDTLVLFYSGLSAMQAKKTDIARGIFESMQDITFPATGAAYAGMGRDLITYLLNIYKETNDTAKSHALIKKSLGKYPNDMNLVIAQLNIYLGEKNYDEAIHTINRALAIPGLPTETKKQILFQAGLSYEKMNKEGLAENAYNDALALDPAYFDAAYELGAMYYNKAVKVNDSMNKVPVNDQAKYNKLLARRNVIFNTKALPALEKSYPLATNESDKLSNAEALLNLYDIMGNKKDKLKDMAGVLKGMYEKMGKTEKAKDMEEILKRTGDK